jgi:pyruvate,water dikinase
MGRRLAELDALDTAEDVFHLRLRELEAIPDRWPPPTELVGDLRAKMIRRRAVRRELENVPLVDPRMLQWAPPAGDILLRGIPGSPGSAQGPVRVIRDSAEFGNLRPGEVLVAPFTNPAWTPLFQLAAAVVVDSGGAVSHAAIVAREYGIPAVMATVDGTRTLTDGTVVRVDGRAGVVLVGD